MPEAFTIGVFSVILDDQDRVLLCRRRDCGVWNLPGGALEKQEAPWQGAVREAKEETGLDVEVIKLVDVSSKYDKNEIVFTFLGKRVGCEIVPTDEADQSKFFAFADIPKNTSPKQVSRIKDILVDKDKLHFRIQGGKSTIELVNEGKL